jgi:hypothetical protein
MEKILPKNEMQCRNSEKRERPQRDYSTMRSFKSTLAVWLALGVATWAQYPGRIESAKKPASTVRAIAVLEWTGDSGKPKASRIIPISVFDGEQYQPGGLYLAKPEPLALEPGTEYVLQDAGVTRGLFDVNTAQDVDGYWFGYGAWKPMAPPPKRPKPKQGRLIPQVVGGDANDGHPHLNRRAGSGSDNSTSTGSTSSSNTQASSNPPASDPDRPTLRRRSDSSNSAPSASSATNADNTAPETAIGGADPDRPRMMHGQQSMSDDYQPAQLTGVPSGLQQMIAVSDATDRETHPFKYLWNDPADAANMQTQMEIAASAAIAASEPAVKPTPKAHTAAHTATTAAQRRKAAAAPPATPPKLVFTNERFKAYELTFNGGATLVFSGEATDHAGKVKYVTLIAQPDFNGVPKVLFKSVTDDDHLDQTPKMRLVDAVDARADNRGDLVFELRTNRDREFVIYRVAGGQAEQVFTTGSLPNSNSQS